MPSRATRLALREFPDPIVSSLLPRWTAIDTPNGSIALLGAARCTCRRCVAESGLILSAAGTGSARRVRPGPAGDLTRETQRVDRPCAAPQLAQPVAHRLGRDDLRRP